MHIYIFAHVHPWMCTCTHVCMYAWIHVDELKKMMGMQTFIIYVGNELITHDLLQRIYRYIFLTMTADTTIATLNVQKVTDMRYIGTNTHISFVLYSIRELESIIIFAHPLVPLSIILEVFIYIYILNRWCLACLNVLGACVSGMHIYSILAHGPYHFKLSIASVQQSNIVAIVPFAIPLKL